MLVRDSNQRWNCDQIRNELLCLHDRCEDDSGYATNGCPGVANPSRYFLEHTEIPKARLLTPTQVASKSSHNLRDAFKPIADRQHNVHELNHDNSPSLHPLHQASGMQTKPIVDQASNIERSFGAGTSIPEMPPSASNSRRRRTSNNVEETASNLRPMLSLKTTGSTVLTSEEAGSVHTPDTMQCTSRASSELSLGHSESQFGERSTVREQGLGEQPRVIALAIPVLTNGDDSKSQHQAKPEDSPVAEAGNKETSEQVS